MAYNVRRIKLSTMCVKTYLQAIVKMVMQLRSCVIILIWAWMCIVPSYAESHAVRLSADAAFAGEVAIKYVENGMGAVTPSPLRGSAGAAGGVGVGYRLAHKGFLFDVGLNLGYTYVCEYRVDSVMRTDAQAMWQGNVVQGSCDTTYTDRKGHVRYPSVQIPIMVGGEWGKWYALAGAKVSVNLYSRAHETGYKKLGWEFPQIHYVDSRMTENGEYQWQPITTMLNLDVRACVEVGYRLMSGERSSKGVKTPSVFVAAFAEYGLYHTSPYAPVVGGVRVTALWNIPKRPHCHCVK